jgi:hypothetical protein
VKFLGGRIGVTTNVQTVYLWQSRRIAKFHKVNRLSPHHRFVIALRSPDGVFETGLPTGPSEKRGTKLACRVKLDSFSSPVCEQNLQNCGDFSRFPEDYSLVSLRSRLRGGESAIRTGITFLNPVNPDVGVTCSQ